MTTFSGSPRVAKGAIVSMAFPGSPPTVIVFQYNPDSIKRTLEAQTPSAGNNRAEALRLTGAPSESIRMTVEIDATDQLEQRDSLVSAMGIHPQLAALELLLYPESARIIANNLLLAVGIIEVIPPEAPLTLLVWGKKRIVPVRVTEFSIEEQAHDTHLNPTLAKVELGFRVLTYNDLPLGHVGYGVFLAHQVAKEAMGIVASVGHAAKLPSTML